MTVNYSAKGEPKQKTIMSFSNPSAYNTIKGLAGGDEIEVTFVKDDKYFNWATVERVAGVVQGTNDKPQDSTVKAQPVVRTSTYETPEERAKKQVYIIKQSCLAQANAYSANRTDGYPTVNETLGIAQQFLDWVMDDGNGPAQN
jgi:hypothetical protein